MSSEIRQELSGIDFPETKVFSGRYNEFVIKPGKVIEFEMGVRTHPSSCIFAGPDGIQRSPVHFDVIMGGGVSYTAVYEGQDITDTVTPQILEKLR